jgi:hypothetical protein
MRPDVAPFNPAKEKLGETAGGLHIPWRGIPGPGSPCAVGSAARAAAKTDAPSGAAPASSPAASCCCPTNQPTARCCSLPASRAGLHHRPPQGGPPQQRLPGRAHSAPPPAAPCPRRRQAAATPATPQPPPAALLPLLPPAPAAPQPRAARPTRRCRCACLASTRRATAWPCSCTASSPTSTSSARRTGGRTTSTASCHSCGWVAPGRAGQGLGGAGGCCCCPGGGLRRPQLAAPGAGSRARLEARPLAGPATPRRRLAVPPQQRAPQHPARCWALGVRGLKAAAPCARPGSPPLATSPEVPGAAAGAPAQHQHQQLCQHEGAAAALPTVSAPAAAAPPPRRASWRAA